MLEDFLKYWWIYWGLLGSAGYLFYRFTKTDSKKPAGKRLSSLIVGSQYIDPDSKFYNPGLTGRMLLIIVIGFILVAFAKLIVWIARG